MILGGKKKKEAMESSDKADIQSRDADFSAEDGAAMADGGSSDCGSSESSALLAELQGQVDKLKLESVENHEKYLRALADFENFKKRAIKERSELVKYQGERIFQDMLEIIDNFERAISTQGGTSEQFRTGIELIHKQFTDLLGKYEVRSESALGKDFDPVRHEALGQVALDDTKPGVIVNELRKAYLYKDKLLRPGGVIVASAASSGSELRGDSESGVEGSEQKE